jgi:hypothetical protein
MSAFGSIFETFKIYIATELNPENFSNRSGAEKSNFRHMSEIAGLHRELVARVLEGNGKAAPELRRAAFGFEVASPEAMKSGARFLLKRGYR